jgi:ribosome-binding protein aMBF1 (putative translation factor)
VTEVTLGGRRYVIVPKSEYVRLRAIEDRAATSDGGVSTGDTLRAAREHAGLTQAELSRKLGKSRTMVALTESGQIRVGERYVAAVLKACGLPKEWRAKKALRAARASRNGT